MPDQSIFPDEEAEELADTLVNGSETTAAILEAAPLKFGDIVFEAISTGDRLLTTPDDLSYEETAKLIATIYVDTTTTPATLYMGGLMYDSEGDNDIWHEVNEHSINMGRESDITLEECRQILLDAIEGLHLSGVTHDMAGVTKPEGRLTFFKDDEDS